MILGLGKTFATYRYEYRPIDLNNDCAVDTALKVAVISGIKERASNSAYSGSEAEIMAGD